MLDGVVDRGNHVADVAFAALVQYAQDHQAGAGRDASQRAIRIVSVAGDDPGDVCAVAVAVMCYRQVIHKIHEADDAVWPEVVVPAGNAGIDDRDAYAGAVVAQLLVDPGGTDRYRASLHRSRNFAVERNRLDLWPPREPAEGVVRNLGNLPADGAEESARPSAGGANRYVGATARGGGDDDPGGGVRCVGAGLERTRQLVLVGPREDRKGQDESCRQT